MKSFVFIALVVFLGTVAVQGYGPKINRKKHGGSHIPPHRSHGEGSRGSHHGPPQRPQHHGSPHHRPSHDHNSGPPNQHGNWDNSPVWDRSDSRDSRGDYDSGGYDRGSYDSYDRDDSSGPDDSYSPDDYSHERDSVDRSDSSYEDSDDWHDHRHPKHPCKKPHTKKPPKPTRKPRPTPPKPKPTSPTPPRPIPTPPRPIPTPPKPITTTPKPTPKPTPPKPITTTTEPTPDWSPRPVPTPPYSRATPTPTGSTAPVRPDTPTPRPIPPPTPTGPVTTDSRPIWHPTPSIEDTTHWQNTPNPDIETTTAIQEGGFTTISPETQECIDLCLSTPEFNPVCGSNGQTYNNEGKLFCAAACGVNVTLRRRSVCPPPNWDYIDDGGETTGTPPPPPPTTTTPPYVGRTTALTDFQRCMKQCRITASFTPVCGTDLVTYMNLDRLKCAQSCGEVVEVLCEKPCAACGFNPATPKTTTTLRTTTPQIGRTTQEPDIQECIKACPVTPEYNPVCGSDHVTYSNPGRLLCAQLCGVAISVTRLGPCGPTTTSTTTTPAPTTTRSPEVSNCIQRCPVTAEYNPVCGTDGLTYTNIGNLRCSSYCGVVVEMKHKSRCVDEFDLGPDGNDSTTTQSTPAIKDNKDPASSTSRNIVTTTTTTTKKPVTPTQTPTPTPTPTPTQNPEPNSSSTLGFTIPNEVLVDIFGSTTTQMPSTKPRNSDEDEYLDLDARFNNDKDTNEETSTDNYHKIIFPD